MQQKVERFEKVDALWPQVKALSYLELKVMRDAIAGEMQEKSDGIRQELRERLAAMSEEYGLSLKDVVGKKKRRPKKPSATEPVSYQNPENPEEVWKGSGRKPKWLKARLDAGEELASFAVPVAAKED